MVMAEEEERPFKAEYAKSGRAGCKLCKGTINKDTLRIAKMVQSPFFDGKQPNWYHFSCFFKQSKPQSVNEISGFGSLRWEDQQRIRDKLGGTDMADGPSSSSSSKKRKTTRSDLQAEYAKSSRSTCKGCFSQILKDEVRLAKMEEADPSEHKGFAGLLPSWYHVDCFLEQLSELGAEGVAADELTGFSKLKQVDKTELSKKFTANAGGTKKGKGKKRKIEESSSSTAVKKSKPESAENATLKKQNELIWKTRDELQANLSTTGLKQLLLANNQAVPTGESNMLHRCADGMVFGALKPCPQCGGQLQIRSHCYQCTGNISAWTKCTHTTDDPDRGEWVIPEDLLDISFLQKYRYKPRKRAFEKEMTPTLSSSSSMDGDSTDGPAGKPARVDAPLKGFSVVIIGRLSKAKAELNREVESLGGRVVTRITDNTTICISDKKEVDKMAKKMQEVEECDVPVVAEDFLTDAAKGAALLKIPPHTISSWGAPRHSLPTDEPDHGKSFKSKGPQKVKLTVKGSAAVDPESELEDSHHVLEEGGVVWNAVLGMVDIVRGTNSYYKLQLLEADSGRRYYVFRSWGRVGTTIGGTKLESHGMSKESAKREFESVYADKTGNSWRERDKFVKHAGKFYPLDIDYGQEETVKLTVGAGTMSKLAPPVQELVKMIFDVESMKKAMLEFEIDMKKMPLGKLSRRQIQSAYSVLTELQAEVSGDQNPTRILDASNRFYTLIPHDFGMRKPPALDGEEIIRTKTMMLDNLLEIEVAYSLLKEEGGSGKDPLDTHYDKLKTDIQVLPKDSEEFGMLAEYVHNTHGSTHTQYELEVLEVFKVVREGEAKRYKPFSKLHNRMLVWHGSRTTNYVGILSQGLRIAPPEAPVTGYMFGKGVYFADIVSKSANYCRTSRSEPTGLMLLCEVALGDMYQLTHAEYVSKLPTGKHSTMGIGRTEPDPQGRRTTESGMIIPMGKGIPSAVTHTSLLYNEYIVYDVSQISMKYLLKMNFKFKW